MDTPKNRMADTRSTRRPRGRPRKHPVEQVEQVEHVVRVTPCPHCGGARLNQWETTSGGSGHPYRRCRGCGNRYVDYGDGSLRLVG
jgi:hypothetical protein